MKRDEWLEGRKQGIGASDIAAVLGISPWKTPLELYLDKRGELPPQEDKPVLRRGRLLEPVVIQIYEDETGRKVTRQQEVVIGDEPFMRCTLDGFDEAVNAPVEVKTVSAFAAKEFGESGTDEIPLHYAAQVHYQVMLTGASTGYLAALIGSDDFRIFELKRDRDLEQLLQARAREFWTRVQNGTPPEPTSESDVALLYPKDRGTVVEANPKTLELLAQATYLKEQIKALEEELEGNKKAGTLGVMGSLKAYMGEASSIVLADQVLATWKSPKSSSKTNWEALAQEIGFTPEQFAKHTKDVQNARRFLIKN